MRKIVKTRWALLIIVLLSSFGVWAQSWEVVGTPGISSGETMSPSIAVKDDKNDFDVPPKKDGTLSNPMQLKFVTTAGNTNIRLPLYGSSLSCTVDWGDGSAIQTINTAGMCSHMFTTPGTYIVTINGTLPVFGFAEASWTGVQYLTEVISFGNIGLTGLPSAFKSAVNLSSVPAVLPTTVNDLMDCFNGIEAVSITNLNLWDVSHVTDMSKMFRDATHFNQSLSSWDVSNVNNMYLMFYKASSFNQPLATWNVSNVTNMWGMFALATTFNQDISSWSVGNVLGMGAMFYGITLSTANYDALLISWAAQTVKPDVEFSGGNSLYSPGAAAAARASLINDDHWTITDGGMNVLTYTWNGSTNASWTNGANWDLNAVPTEYDNVVIANAGTAPQISSSDQVSCNALTVNSGASLTISSGGSLIANSSSGTVIVKRTLSGTNQYHFISSPVNNADLSTVFDPSLHDKIYLRRYDEPSGNWMNITIPALLSNGVGYSYYRSVVKVVSTLATFTGNLITSDVTPSISNNGPAGNDQYKGYNLIGNPYTSAIKWGQGNWNRSNVDDAVYVWSNGVYKSYVGGVGALTNGVIPAQQGFFIKANGASPSITIPSASRVHNTQAFYKNSIANTLRLEVANNINDYVDATFIRFAPEATALFDNQLDAYKLENDAEAPMIYTIAGDDLLSVNSLPSSTQYSEIMVSFTAGVNGRYSITASGMESFGNSNIVLMDMLTNTTQNLALNPNYSFDATTLDASNRFKVSFASVGIDDNPLQSIGIYSYDGKIMVQLPEVTKAEVIITNMAGQVVASHFINAVGLIELPVAVSSGIYVVSVKGQAGIVTRKVFVR